jgi:hypothetical protein
MQCTEPVHRALQFGFCTSAAVLNSLEGAVARDWTLRYSFLTAAPAAATAAVTATDECLTGAAIIYTSV